MKTIRIKEGYYKFKTPLGIWTIYKKSIGIFRNGYSNWDGKKSIFVWKVYDQNNKQVGLDFNTKKEALDYFSENKFCFKCMNKKGIYYGQKFCKCDEKIIYYYDKEGNTIPSKIYKETEEKYLILGLNPNKKIWVNKKNCEMQS